MKDNLPRCRGTCDIFDKQIFCHCTRENYASWHWFTDLCKFLAGTDGSIDGVKTCKKDTNQNSVELVCKPGSVRYRAAIIHLGLSLLTASSNLPESDAGNIIAFLFGLAPSGVYLTAFVTKSAVRSYRTISPLPLA